MAFNRTDQKKGWTVGVLVLAAIWLGMLVGVSFIAAPAKFLAPSLSLPVALDVGRQTFATFNRTEWILSVLLVGLALFGAKDRLSLTAVALVASLVVAETVWLLPQLDDRVGLIIAGQQPGPSNLHTVYIVFEAAKLCGLLVIMVDVARRIATRTSCEAPLSLHSELNPASR